MLVIVYPIPFDAWGTFATFLTRFTDTFKQFPPGLSDYKVVAVCNWGMAQPEHVNAFYGIKTQWLFYHESGCDIGSAQFTAKYAVGSGDDLVLAMTSRCYFHREGWGRRYVEAFQKYGDGLYGTFASRETGKAHIGTRGYMMRAARWCEYQHKIDSRENGPRFEIGEWSISDWFREKNLPLVQVLWDGEQLEGHWRDVAGCFRSEDQRQCLVFDKHTDIYRDASPEEKKRLEEMAEGK